MRFAVIQYVNFWIENIGSRPGRSEAMAIQINSTIQHIFNSIQYQAIQFNSIQINSLNSIQLNSIQTIQFNSIQILIHTSIQLIFFQLNLWSIYGAQSASA